jgi:hypothetical protein
MGLNVFNGVGVGEPQNRRTAKSEELSKLAVCLMSLWGLPRGGVRFYLTAPVHDGGGESNGKYSPLAREGGDTSDGKFH